jgi:NAD(P)-dependent dehydrogenase (short-subunit alcohol dehydrogenase family)
VHRAGSIAVSVIPRGGIFINDQIRIEGFRESSLTDVLYLASDESKYITGSKLTIDGGILAESEAKTGK